MLIYLPDVDAHWLNITNTHNSTLKDNYEVPYWEESFNNTSISISGGRLQLKNYRLYYDCSPYLKDWPIFYLFNAIPSIVTSYDGYTIDIDASKNVFDLVIYYDLVSGKLGARLISILDDDQYVYKIDNDQLIGFLPQYLYALCLYNRTWDITTKYHSLVNRFLYDAYYEDDNKYLLYRDDVDINKYNPDGIYAYNFRLKKAAFALKPSAIFISAKCLLSGILDFMYFPLCLSETNSS